MNLESLRLTIAPGWPGLVVLVHAYWCGITINIFTLISTVSCLDDTFYLILCLSVQLGYKRLIIPKWKGDSSVKGGSGPQPESVSLRKIIGYHSREMGSIIMQNLERQEDP